MKKSNTSIHLSKIEHRNETRIEVKFKKDNALIKKIKTIEGRKWSKTKNCWHLPYSKTSFNTLQKVFGEENIFYKKKNKQLEKKPLPKGNIIPKLKEYVSIGEIHKKYIGEKILVQKLSKKSLKVYAPHNKKGWKEVIKNIAGRRWNKEKSYWIIPNVKSSFYSLKENIGLNNLILDLIIEKDIPDHYVLPKEKSYPTKTKKPRGWEKLNEEQKKTIQQVEERIILERLSQYTLKSYRNHLISIFLFFKNTLPENLTSSDIQKYLLHQIKFKNISESTQVLIINAIKSYWEKVLQRPKSIIKLPSPKRPKKLPNVLSTSEVSKLINAPKNLKHKLLLLLIYSAGLRKGEVLNLLKSDINIKRRTIHIKGGKGKKDRYVVLAETVIPYLVKYKKEYSPSRWLFEGNYGGKYSGSSLQKIFTLALESSQANPYSTIHTLRHSYATHCVEAGHDIKLVQEALGHNSLATTEIYLHLSSPVLRKMKSPLDNISLE